jgi:hypothetical protein
MRLPALLLSWALLPAPLACAHPHQVAAKGQAPAPAPGNLPAHRVDFATQVQPILQARCQPCHFPGGKVYGPMPFDRAETVLRLREKLFTRIKDEEQRQPIRAFLAENPALLPPVRQERK